jgi:hypothetical protein
MTMLPSTAVFGLVALPPIPGLPSFSPDAGVRAHWGRPERRTAEVRHARDGRSAEEARDV